MVQMQDLQNMDIVKSQTKPLDQLLVSADHSYELAIVGSGISCSYTLIHYILLLKKKLAIEPTKTTVKTIKIAVLDKSGEFWTGIPYGSRTGKQSLIITPLKEFLPQPERDRFINWLRKNYTSVLLDLEQRPGILNSQWLKSYQGAMNEGNWDELFLPRYIFGWYLKERVENLLDEAYQKNYLQCDLISADACNIHKLDGAYKIDTTKSKSLIAKKIVLAIGSPPNKAAVQESLEALTNSKSSRSQICCITNMYEPSQNHNVERMLNFLRKADSAQPRQVLIIGSNASALETLYSLNNLPETAELIDKFIILSPAGEFPHRISNDPLSTSYIPHNLTLLTNQEHFTAKQILEAVKKDVDAALRQNETINSTYGLISQGVIKALNKLSYPEQKLFVTKYGVEIGKFQRRAGGDYLDVVDKLIFEGKLQFIKGKFTSTIPLAKGQLGFEFLTETSNQPEIYTSPIQVLINCAGFQNLTTSSSPLINSLIDQEICIPNDSLCGFEMNENFEAHENLYLMGPLVAGNINQKLKVWHAESCGRIFGLSHTLAEVLL